MIDFDDQMKAALARPQAPPEFARQVLARVEAAGRARPSAWHSWAAAGIAASLLVGSWGIVDLEQRRERQQASAAHAQLMRALSITSSKLQRIQKKLEGYN